MNKSLKLPVLILCLTILSIIFTFIVSYIYVEQNSKLNLIDALKKTNLYTHKGYKASNLNLNEHPSLLFFGFTHCPEVCPTTLGKLQNIINDINISKKKIKIIFITLDPNRDTIENLNNYLEGFDEIIIGLTGNIDEIKKISNKWNIFWEKVPYNKNNKNDYNINHTATVFMINNNGDFSGTISWGEHNDSIKLKIKKLLNY